MMLTLKPNFQNERVMKEIFLLLFIAFLVLMGTHSTIFSLVAFAVGCCVIILGNQFQSLEMILFLAPMATIFKASPDSFAFLTYLELFYVLLYLVRQRFKIGHTEGVVILFGVYLLIIQIFNGDIDFNVTLKMIAALFMLSIATKLNVEGEVKRLFIVFILGVIISSLFANIDNSFFPIKQFVGMKGYGTGYGGYIVRFSGLYRDPNYYSVNIIIALCAIILLYKSRKLSSYIAIIFATLLIAFAVETVSKSAIIMLALPAVMLLYVMFKERRYGLFFVGVIAIACIIMLAFSNRIPALDNIMRRFMSMDANLDSLTTHRSTLWMSYLSYLSDNISEVIFGRSLMNYTLNGAAPHNTYIDLIYQLGLVGTTFLLMIVKRIFGMRGTYKERSILNYSILSCIVIMYFFLSELQYYDLPFHLILCYFALNFNIKNIKEN